LTDTNTPIRISFWDNTKGILIFLVVLGHFLLPYFIFDIPETLLNVIYIFHMPAFVFVSGYFSKKVSDLKSSILKLCIAYILFNYSMMLYAKIYENIDFSLLKPYYSYWYLLALVIWRLIIPFVPKSKMSFITSLLFMFLIGFWSEVNNVLALSRIVGFFPFFLAGYMLSENKINLFLFSRVLMHKVLGVILFTFSLIVCVLVSHSGISIDELIWFPYSSYVSLIYRLLLAYLSATIILSFMLMIPTKPIRFISKWGRNSLPIFILHRYIPLLFTKIFPQSNYHTIILLYIILASILTTALLGADRVNFALLNVLEKVAKSITNNKQKRKRTFKMVYLWFFVILIIPQIYNLMITLFEKPEVVIQNNQDDMIHPILTAEQQRTIDKAVSIAFVGDLILLQDQVREAWNEEMQNYDFEPLFEYATKYLQDADFSIGVLEGPLAGSEAGYSTSNYDDGIPMYLNFPDSFADAIQKAGINLVTLANNHLLDKGIEGVYRTIEVLEKKQINYIGAYRNSSEKTKVKIIKVKNLHVAFLAYTIPSNFYEESYFFKENPAITSVLVSKNSPYFNQALKQVQADFANAKKENPDFIIVLPHMGTQFIHTTDSFQELWNDIFVQLGADVVLGNHAHAVQPIEFRIGNKERNERNSVIVNCPGNFVNSYVNHNGDATSIVKIFLHADDKNVVCAGVLPMWTQTLVHKQHRALPVYDILHDAKLQTQISIYDLNRVEKVHELISTVMLNVNLTLDQSQKVYYLFPDGYYRQPAIPLTITESMKNNELYKLLKNKNICFVGDSITKGSKNGGYGWFEPLVGAIEGISTTVEAWGGATTKTLLDSLEQISNHKADIYVIAIGTNDIRYRNKHICAMTAESYTRNLLELTSNILADNSVAQFVFITPWPTMGNDPYTPLDKKELDLLFSDYEKSLEQFCKDSGFLFINPGKYILQVLNQSKSTEYLLDHIHPNASKGIQLYSKSVLMD
jgi:fucose 4-O-acetylase-like acetyltransferase/poly-gamma-glutamate capsule biosynthesis protein CapA/YwtB (metallophosphatase superfamily)/lysophospholipase L1-like esterase